MRPRYVLAGLVCVLIGTIVVVLSTRRPDFQHFRQSVDGMTAQAVLGKYGRPSIVTNESDGKKTWIYNDILARTQAPGTQAQVAVVLSADDQVVSAYVIGQ